MLLLRLLLRKAVRLRDGRIVSARIPRLVRAAERGRDRVRGTGKPARVAHAALRGGGESHAVFRSVLLLPQIRPRNDGSLPRGIRRHTFLDGVPAWRSPRGGGAVLHFADDIARSLLRRDCASFPRLAQGAVRIRKSRSPKCGIIQHHIQTRKGNAPWPERKRPKSA